MGVYLVLASYILIAELLVVSMWASEKCFIVGGEEIFNLFLVQGFVGTMEEEILTGL